MVLIIEWQVIIDDKSYEMGPRSFVIRILFPRQLCPFMQILRSLGEDVEHFEQFLTPSSKER